MTERQTRIDRLTATIANHRRVGNEFMATTMEKSLHRFQAMTDDQYTQFQKDDAQANPQRRAMAKTLANEFFAQAR